MSDFPVNEERRLEVRNALSCLLDLLADRVAERLLEEAKKKRGAQVGKETPAFFEPNDFDDDVIE